MPQSGGTVNTSAAKRQWQRLEQAIHARRERLSTWFMPTPTMRRPSLFHSMPITSVMPTYQLDPEKRFNADKVQAMLVEVMTTNLLHKQYSEREFTHLSTDIGEEIRAQLKRIHFDRYRLVCHVQIAQRRDQGFYSRARFLWDSERDDSASFYMETPHLLASCLVLGVYKE